MSITYTGFKYGRIYNNNVTRSDSPINGKVQYISPAYDMTGRDGHVIVYNYRDPATLPKDFWGSDYSERSMKVILSDSTTWSGSSANNYNGARNSNITNTFTLPSNPSTLTVATTFDLDDFYIYDKTAHEYIFSGVNIDVSYSDALTLLKRRAVLTGKEQIPDVNVELPDYWRLDFTTTEADEQIRVGYYSLNSSTFADLILDGTSNKSLGVNGPAAYVRIPTAGQHTMYIKINLPFTNSNYFFGLQEHDYSYVRIPYNWDKATLLGNYNTPKIQIDRMDIMYPQLYLKNNSYYWLSHISQLYVPNANLAWYKAYAPTNSVGYTKIADSIKGANFIYTTN